MLPATLPDGESNLGGVLAFHQPDVHVDMPDVLDEGTPWSLNSDDTGLDGNVNTLGDIEFFCRVDVPHLLQWVSKRILQHELCARWIV